MKLEKIELLVNKIDHAINIIQKLKDINTSQEKQIEKLNKENEKIKEENKKLKEENLKQKEEIDQTNDLHQRLEEKIQQILQYLPEEDNNEIEGNNYKDKSSQQKDKEKEKKKETNKNKEKIEEDKTKVNKEKKYEEKDEERLEKLVNEPEQFEKKSLFTHDEENNEEIELNEDISEQGLIEEEVVDVDIKQNEESNVNFDDTLLDEDDSNIEFDFEDESGNDNKDLPKGVL